MGTSLLEASIKRAKRANVNALSVQCAPETSLGFWKRKGFEKYRDPQRDNDLLVRLVLSRAFRLPSNLSPVEVVIGFYPEAAQYYGGQDIPPIIKHCVAGVRDLDGSIMLQQRVVGLRDDEPHGDLTIKIEVNGVKRCFCKAKHNDAQDVGVQRDGRGNTFFIDRVKSKERDN